MIKVHPRSSLSTKLSLRIVLLAAPIFVLALGILFTQSRHIIRKEAMGRMKSVLSATTQRLCRNVTTVETATHANGWLVTYFLHPDSLLALTRRIVQTNPHIDGCSISAEPFVFPELGRYFSAYTIREKADQGKDTVVTVVEEQYEYFAKDWYKLPCKMGKPCWVDFYDETDSLELTLDGMIASYSKPLYDSQNKLVAVISTDLSLLRLSKTISEDRPFKDAYYMMVDKDGRFVIHPDSTRLFAQTIFTDADPQQQADVIALGHEMTAGNSGNMSVTMDGVPCLVCYQPVPGTSWSMALVCPDSSVLAGYHKLTYIVLPLLFFGLFAVLLLCHRSVRRAIQPLHQLLGKSQTIASGNMEVHIPRSERIDVVGRLQNSFATMLSALNFHMGSVRYSTDLMKQRNEELVLATQLAKEADRQKTAFIQSVSHQIRTPLNIIMGFAQILSVSKDTGDSFSEGLSEEELKSITNTMDHNAKLLYRMVAMLFDSSDTGTSEELNSLQTDMVACNDVAREAISYLKEHYPDINVSFHTEAADSLYIRSNRLYLMRCLRELLYNAAKYSDGQHVSVNIMLTDNTVCFIVQDTGKGIAEADREQMFKFFTKVDYLSEGLGLGLPLSKRHAQNLGGDLTLDEGYHDGCRFIVKLPLKS